MTKENIILEKSFNFAIRIINLYKFLRESKKEYTLSKQILRCGTSVGANAEEAVGGYSKKDFRAKMSISYKEIRETKYWLRLLKETDYITKNQFNSLYPQADEIARILYSIVNSEDK